MTAPLAGGLVSTDGSDSGTAVDGASPAPSASITWIASELGPGTSTAYSFTANLAALQTPHVAVLSQLPPSGYVLIFGVTPDGMLTAWIATCEAPTVPVASEPESWRVAGV